MPLCLWIFGALLPQEQSLIIRVDDPRAMAHHDAEHLGGPFYRVDKSTNIVAELGKTEALGWAIPEGRRRIILDQAGTVADLQWYLLNDGSLAYLWPLIEAGADINIQDAWTTSLGNHDVVIAVLDTGIATNHPNLPPNRRLPGWDFVDHDDDPSPVGTQPNAAHGTMVAALALGSGTDSGIVGVCPNCSLLPVRVLAPDDTVRDGDMVAAILWAAERADVINASWSFDPLSYVSFAVYDAIRWSMANGRDGRGTTVVFSAGNRAAEIDDFAPEAMPETITVGATDERDLRAGYSNHGHFLTIMAPGGMPDDWTEDGRVPRAKLVTADLIGSLGYNPARDAIYAPDIPIDPDYTAAFWGTSGATPLVSGAAALLRSVRPELSPEEIGWILTETAAKIGGVEYLDGFNTDYGHGRLDTAAAITLAASGDYCESNPEICDNLRDEDCDRLIDNDDPDCGAERPRAFQVPLGLPCDASGVCIDGYCSTPQGRAHNRFCTADCDYDCPGGGVCIGVGADAHCYVGCNNTDDCPTETRCEMPDFAVVPPEQSQRACLPTCDGNWDCFVLSCVNGVCAGVAQLDSSSTPQDGCDCRGVRGSPSLMWVSLALWLRRRGTVNRS